MIKEANAVKPALMQNRSPLVVSIRASFTIGVLTVGLLAQWVNGSAELPPLPASEQAVIEGLLREEISANTSGEQVVRDAVSLAHFRFTNSYEKFIEGLRQEGQRRGPAFGEAVENMLKSNETEARISIPTDAPKPIHLVSEKELNEPTNWTRFRDKYKDSSEVITVSRVGLDSKGNIAVVCFGIEYQFLPGIAQVRFLKPEGKRWAFEAYHRSLGGPGGVQMPNVVCELRYYHSGPFKKSLVIHNYSTNVLCSVAKPERLWKSTNGLSAWDVSGFILQVVEPPRYAGQVLTAHFEGPVASGDPFRAFTFAKRYQLEVAEEILGSLDFTLCY